MTYVQVDWFILKTKSETILLTWEYKNIKIKIGLNEIKQVIVLVDFLKAHSFTVEQRFMINLYFLCKE